jgi:hypothetical protein
MANKQQGATEKNKTGNRRTSAPARRRNFFFFNSEKLCVLNLRFCAFVRFSVSYQGSFKHAIALFKALLNRFNGVVIKSN